MNTKQTKVALALNVAGAKVAAVTKDARKPSIPAPTQDEMINLCVAAFAEYQEAERTLANAKAEWDAARMGLRTELARAKEVIDAGKPWAAFLKRVREALVAAGIVATVKAAGKLVDNQLIALNLTGQSSNKGGRKSAKRGTKARAANVEFSVADYARMAAFVREEQAEADGDRLEVLGMLAKLVNRSKRAGK